MSAPSIKMNDGCKIPQIGLGTWLIKNENECKTAVKLALNAGYTHIDTAQRYNNEQFVGDAIKESGVDRKKVFITTKISIDNFSTNDLLSSFDDSLKKLQTDYVDLLLLHFPVPNKRGPAWIELEKLNKSGRAKSIGVSNYTITHLEELLSACTIKPAINQVEIHVFLRQPELIDFCKKHEIVVEAYAPLVHGMRMNDTALNAIAKKHNKTVAQIMLRWCVERGLVVLPKSTHESRIKENIDIFDFKLDDEDKSGIDKLEDNFRACWDPTNVA